MNSKYSISDTYDAFISYRHQSGFYMAQVIYDKLLQNGYSVYMDKHLERGPYENQIKTAIEKSRNFILILFPHDLDNCNNDDDWMKKETEWATSTPDMHFIPVFCEGFDTKSIGFSLPDSINLVLSYQGVIIHKDNSLDSDLDKLCDIALSNVSPVKSLINTVDFFNINLNERPYLRPKSVDIAFHGGAKWFDPAAYKGILDTIIDRKIPLRVLINTVEAAEKIASKMRDEKAIYHSFEEVKKYWTIYSKEFADTMQVRLCPIPILRVYHNIKYESNEGKETFDRMHVKYYAYANQNLDNAFQHELSSYSKFYKIYQNEFEFLWDSSEAII